MPKEYASTTEEYFASLSPQQKKEFDEGLRNFALSEMILAAMQEDKLSVKELAKIAGGFSHHSTSHAFRK